MSLFLAELDRTSPDVVLCDLPQTAVQLLVSRLYWDMELDDGVDGR